MLDISEACIQGRCPEAMGCVDLELSRKLKNLENGVGSWFKL